MTITNNVLEGVSCSSRYDLVVGSGFGNYIGPNSFNLDFAPSRRRAA